jgi:manganese/zinc/iron transport system permease protein
VAVAIEFIHKKFRMPQDASIGITYTFLFAVGVILISRYAGQVDLDQECVLYGEIAYVPFDLYGEIPRQVLISGALFVILLSTLLMGYRGLKLTTFDPAYASSIGISVLFWHYLIMGMVSITTVISFESVGAVLVIALLVGPAATASLFATRLNQMILISGFIGVLTSIGGYTLATFLNASIAGCIAVVTGISFLTGVVIKKYLIR